MSCVEVDSLSHLATILEQFFHGLSECGLMQTFSVQLQAVAVDVTGQIKFRYLIHQFIKNLQTLLNKFPAIEGHESSHDVETQTWPCAGQEIVVDKCLLPSVSRQATIPEQADPLVEACVFSQNTNELTWDSGSDALKCEPGTNYIPHLTGPGDIIVTCHPTLAAIAVGSYVTGAATVINGTFLNSNEIMAVQNVHGNDQDSNTTLAIVPNEVITCTTSPALERKQSVERSEQKPFLETLPVSELKTLVVTNLENGRLDGEVPCQLAEDDQPSKSLAAESCCENRDGADMSKLSEDVETNEMHITVSQKQKPNYHKTRKVERNKSDNLGEAIAGALFICEVCERTFNTVAKMEVHLHTHTSKGQCNMCPKRFGTLQSLQEHCRTDHGGAGCFRCRLCGRRFMTKLSHNRHMDSHRGMKGAVCDICGKMFSRTDYLHKHYMTHTGHRPFQCTSCPRKFISNSQLKVHQLTHTGVKEHLCDVCNKAFSRSDKLKDHVLRHLKIKRFQCTVCEKYYAEKRDLLRHSETHTTPNT